jgi:methionyl-tRNA formyltransferase
MNALADLGKEALWDVLEHLDQIQPIQQNAALFTHAKKITPQDGEVDWTKPALAVHNQIRGVTPNPGAWCWVLIKGEQKRLLIKKTLPIFTVSGKPGEILSRTSSELLIGCRNGSLSLLEIQLEGKKVLSADIFLRGISISSMQFVVEKDI